MARRPAARPYKQNRLQQLRGFCATVQAGSVSAAAQRMGLSQPAVTLQIRALERELGVRLFERDGRSIRLSTDGRMLFELAFPIVERIDGLESSYAAMRGELNRGQLEIAAGESTILYILPRYVQQFSEAYPDIELKLHNVTGRRGMAMLRSGEAEFAVGSMVGVPQDLFYFPTFSYRPMLITPLDHPLTKIGEPTPQELSRYPFILPPRQLTTWTIVMGVFEQHGCHPHVRVQAGGWEVIKKYVALGLGVSIVTSVCLTGHEPLGRIPVEKYFPKRTYGIVVRQDKFLSPQAERFLDMIAPGFRNAWSRARKEQK